MICAVERPHNDGAPMTLAFLPRLAAQLDNLPLLLGGAEPEALRRKSPSGRWSAHENVAHIARQQEVFLSRVRRILAEDGPALPQYRAEDDPDWPAWLALSTDEVLRRLGSGRTELVAVLERVSPAELARTGTHSRFGPLSLALWVEFFLDHEAHHLYTIFKRARGAD